LSKVYSNNKRKNRTFCRKSLRVSRGLLPAKGRFFWKDVANSLK
jgi:hypothetical protein